MQQILLFKLPISVCPTGEHFLDRLDQSLLTRRSLTVTFVNPYAWQVRDNHPTYENDLKKLDLVLADGIGVVKAVNWLSGIKIARLSFDSTSLYSLFMDRLCQHRKSLFIVGGASGVARRAGERMQEDFPELSLNGCLSGFEDHQTAIDQVLTSGADAVLCGMGQPHQERFIVNLRDAGFQGIAISCGGFLDQLIKAETYYPSIIDRLELRWFYRLVMEPKRLGKRYLVDYWTFIIALLAHLPARFAKGPLNLPTVIHLSPQDRPAE